jgi:hypothetical protein
MKKAGIQNTIPEGMVTDMGMVTGMVMVTDMGMVMDMAVKLENDKRLLQNTSNTIRTTKNYR